MKRSVLRLHTRIQPPVTYSGAQSVATTNGSIKVTVHVGTDQNLEIEIFAEHKYILNELLVKKESLRDMTNEFLPEVKLYDLRRTLGVNFSRHVRFG